MGLQFGHDTTANCKLTTTKWGNCIIRAATRRRYPASQLLMLQNPHRRRCGGAEAPQSMAAGTGTVAEPGPVAVAGRQARHNSPSTPSPPLNPRQNSPSNLKNVKFGVFRARRANFFAHRTQRRGDFETNDASATADAGQHETAVTTVRP